VEGGEMKRGIKGRVEVERRGGRRRRWDRWI
jgi:hypothetical protein